jgi:hypothetical protein
MRAFLGWQRAVPFVRQYLPVFSDAPVGFEGKNAYIAIAITCHQQMSLT